MGRSIGGTYPVQKGERGGPWAPGPCFVLTGSHAHGELDGLIKSRFGAAHTVLAIP